MAKADTSPGKASVFIWSIGPLSEDRKRIAQFVNIPLSYLFYNAWTYMLVWLSYFWCKSKPSWLLAHVFHDATLWLNYPVVMIPSLSCFWGRQRQQSILFCCQPRAVKTGLWLIRRTSGLLCSYQVIQLWGSVWSLDKTRESYLIA